MLVSIESGECYLGFLILMLLTRGQRNGIKLWVHQENHEVLLIHLEYILVNCYNKIEISKGYGTDCAVDLDRMMKHNTLKYRKRALEVEEV